MGEVRWKGMISYISEEKHGVCYLLLLLTNGPQGLEGEHTRSPQAQYNYNYQSLAKGCTIHQTWDMRG